MRISVAGDSYINWDGEIPAIEDEPFPWGFGLGVTALLSPCRSRRFATATVGFRDFDWIFYSVAVEYTVGDPILEQLEMGGGITWTEYFTNWDKIMLITHPVVGPSSSTLVDCDIYRDILRSHFDPLGNTGAWELYRRWAEEIRDSIATEIFPSIKISSQQKWDKYLVDYNRRFPRGLKSA